MSAFNSPVREYSNGEIIVLWQAEKCIHCVNCARGLSSVFKPKERPWVQLEHATSQEIVEAVGRCPSGALSMKED